MIQTGTLSKEQNSFLAHWDPRCKLIGFFILMLSFALVRNLMLLPFMAVTAFLVFFLSPVPASVLLPKLRLPGIFVMIYGLILVFGSGTTILFQMGPLALKAEGLLNFVVIAVRLFSILTLATVLFASTPITELTSAMQSLGLPLLLADMILFTNRYIFQLADDMQKTRYAARLRGFQGKSPASLQTFAYIVGTLLVRSHAQSERVYQAMTLRGYGQNQVPAKLKGKTTRQDLLALLAGVFLSGLFIIAQTLL